MSQSTAPKNLPMKYKAMLYASISFIHNHVPQEQQGEYYGKLPIFNTVEEQIAYFDEKSDIKKIEQTVYKPMVKEQKKKEKEADKPVKEKKPRAPRKKKECTEPTSEISNECKDEKTEEIRTGIINIEEAELQLEEMYPDSTEIVSSNPEPPCTVPNTKEEVKEVKKPKEKKKREPKKKEPKESKPKPLENIDYLMVPPSVIPEGRYWTRDEDFRNGPLFANGKDKDGDTEPGEYVGKLVDGVAIFDN